MPASPICEVKDGLGPWTPTADGVNVTPGGTVSIHLVDATDVAEWYLRIFGTDEDTPTPPTLTDVNPLTNKVVTPSTTVTFTADVSLGHALLFESVIVTATQTIPTTFGVYELAANGLRVGAVGETREGSVNFGWAKTYNEAIRSIGSGFTAGGDLSGSSTSQTVIGLQGRTLAATAPATGEVLKWSGAQWEPGIGGGFTAGGDLTGTSTDQTVSKIRGIDSPDPAAFSNEFYIRCQLTALMDEPRTVVYDGTHLWLITKAGGAFTLYQIDPSTRTILNEVAISGRSIAVDGTYVYVTTFDDNHVALVNKTTLTIDGWAYVGTQANNIALDGADNFCVTTDGTEIQKFVIANVVGQVRFAHTADATLTLTDTARTLFFGDGYYWVLSQPWGTTLWKVDPLTFTVTTSNSYVQDVQSVLHAFGYVWITTNSAQSVLQIDPTTLTQVQEIVLPGRAYDICVGPDSTGTPNTWLWICGNNEIFSVDPVLGYQGSAAGTNANDRYESVTSVGSHVWVSTRYTDPMYQAGLRDFDAVSALQVGVVVKYTSALIYQKLLGDVIIDNLGNTTVAYLQGRSVSSFAPSTGNVLAWNGFQWAPAVPGGGGSVSGDLSGTVPGSITVVGIRNRTVSSTTPTTGYFYRWSGTQWEPRAALYGLTTNALAYANASGVPQSLVGTVAGQVATWNGTQWTAAAAGGGGTTFTMSNSNVSSPGCPVVLRTNPTDGLLYAVVTQDYDFSQDMTDSFTSVGTLIEATLPTPTGFYPMDACPLEIRDHRLARGFLVAYAYGTNLRIRLCTVTYANASSNPSSPTMSGTLDIPCTTSPQHISCCCISYTQADRALVAYVDSGVAKVVCIDTSTSPPTAGTPIAFNTWGSGTVTALAVATDTATSYQGCFYGWLVWGLSGDISGDDPLLCTRVRVETFGALTLVAQTTALYPPGPTAIFREGYPAQHAPIVPWAQGYGAEYTPQAQVAVAWGHAGQRISHAQSQNTFWPDNVYAGRLPTVRVDGPSSNGTAMGYLIDSGVSYRPAEGCFLDDTCFVSIVWGSRAGFDATFINVVDKNYDTLTVRHPQVLFSTEGDLSNPGDPEQRYPAPKMRGVCCKRMGDRSFAFAGWMWQPYYTDRAVLVVGTGYVRSGGVNVGYKMALGSIMWTPNAPAPAYSYLDDLQRAVPVRMSDNYFYVVYLRSNGAAPDLYYTQARMANNDRTVGISTNASSPVSIQPTGATTFNPGFTLEPGAAIFRKHGGLLSVAGYYHPGRRYRVGYAISSTLVAYVPPESD